MCRWSVKGQSISLGKRGMIMGILNVTPDSFSDGGLYCSTEQAVRHGLKMFEEGADIIDVGGESTRPGADRVDEEEEISRIYPVIEELSKIEGLYVSIDTSKAVVAKAAMEAGAHIINDVTGLGADPEMVGVCQQSDVGIVVMHMKGSPRTMQNAPDYEDVVKDVRAYLYRRYRELVAAGISAERLCFDPGIGFGKTVEHNLALLRALSSLQVEDCPLLLGVSRKSFIGKVLDEEDAEARDWPTVGLTAYACTQGVHIHRVHDVKKNVESLRMMEAINL